MWLKARLNDDDTDHDTDDDTDDDADDGTDDDIDDDTDGGRGNLYTNFLGDSLCTQNRLWVLMVWLEQRI